MTYDLKKLRDLESRISEAKGANQELNADLWVITKGLSERNYHHWRACQPKGENPTVRVYALDRAPNLTGSIDAVVSLVERVLPGWLWRIASCSVSDDAWVMPDFNHPVHGPALLKWATNAELQDWFTAHPETDIDQRPPGRPALALCKALVAAMIVKESPR
jgi:hypothetical protein